MKLFCILDVKANTFLNIRPEPNTATAIRGFALEAENPQSMISKYPDDFALCELASFDVQTGRLTVLDNYVNLGSARNFMRPTDSEVRKIF